ncbi:conserved hypothetical protein [Candidatus Zixiibacteriota bacterium]|nr:conserved hypothetical protein [candidate division Zixibacteria bacterium]
MSGYYREKLAGERLKRCYDIAGPRIRQYLKAEIDFVTDHIRPGSRVLELGCGCGRILPELSKKAGMVVGIDNAAESIHFGSENLRQYQNCLLAVMDAVNLGFGNRVFDYVVCIQNGISAFHVNQEVLIRESIRVTKPGGKIFFSTYADKFWPYRLEWFERQAEEGLVGEIDHKKTGKGIIVCKDGFTATTVDGEGYFRLTSGLKIEAEIEEIDGSSLFCLITAR